ncbi:MAG TPA: murein L,D-transpeptidase family protein [Hyphomicrobium sp.]|nr:murein L,D-transpeptidase family protein [Hyphomicrobium sp.]
MRIDPEQAPNRPSRRRRLIRPRTVFIIAFGVLAVAGAFIAARFPPFGGSIEDKIAYERADRLWRTTSGLPLPGAPDTSRLTERLAEHGVREGAPVLVRIFKKEFELELWIRRDGAFHRFVTYPICRWSGTLGPKFKEGDGQAPEGFYSVDAKALNPNSSYYRSFNVGYPNAFDVANGRTGSLIMVHGACASVGCFAMTNDQMGEIWRLVTAALSGGQKRFQVQIYPFRMTDDALKAQADHPAHPFWTVLKRGNDLFEASSLPPRVSVCRGGYRFSNAGVYLDGDGGIENSCSENFDKS